MILSNHYSLFIHQPLNPILTENPQPAFARFRLEKSEILLNFLTYFKKALMFLTYILPQS